MRFVFLALLCCLPASALAQDAFPRCTLSADASKAFHAHYGQARIWTLEGRHDRARKELEEALRLCVDPEVLLRMADNAAQRGDEAAAALYQRDYDAQLSMERRVAQALLYANVEPRRLSLDPEQVYLDTTTSPRRLMLGTRPPQTPVFIEATSAPNVTIEILDAQGTSRFWRPGEPGSLPRGRYTVAVRAPGWNTISREIEISGRQPIKMFFVLSRTLTP